MKPDEGPFYVGYQPKAPAELSRHLPKLLTVLGFLAFGLGLLLAAQQQPAGPGRFEWGRPQRFVGRIEEHPSPVLWVDRAGGTGAGQSSYDLVSTGKHGAGRQFQGLNGQWVSLAGVLIDHPSRTLIEVVDGSVEELEIGPDGNRLVSDFPESGDLGEVVLFGEVVDSKCYAGVMKPGRGKTHRDCAVRCIAGGIPAVFVVETTHGSMLTLDLVDEEGSPMGTKLLDRVAEPLEVKGRVLRRGDRLVLKAPVSAFVRPQGQRSSP
jgi:hypothetical protein